MPITRLARTPGQPHSAINAVASSPGAVIPKGFKTGSEARRVSEERQNEQTLASEKRARGLDLAAINQYRLRLQEGEQADIILLDATFNVVPFADEHHMPDANGRWSIFEFCPREYDLCPLCDPSRNPSYTMFLTVLDLRGYRNSTTQVTVPFVKRLAAFKGNTHAELWHLHDEIMREHGTIRGAHILLARDGTINAATGHPIPLFDDGKLYEMLTEAELTAEYGNSEMRDTETNALVKPTNFDIAPYEYARIFVPPTGADLRSRYGTGSAPAGSRQDVEAGWGAGSLRQGQAGGTQMRTRSRLSATAVEPVPQTRVDNGPVQPGAIPPRTRTRVVSSEAAVQPGATSVGEPRTRSRVSNALTGSKEAF